MQKIQDCDTKIEDCNAEVQVLEKEKATITSRLEREDPIPMLKATKKLYRGTKIMGTAASLILQDEMGASKYMEIDTGNPDNPKQITHQTLNL